MLTRPHHLAGDGARRAAGRLLLLVALACGWSAAGLFLWRSSVPSSLTLPHLDPRSFFTPQQLARADSFQRVHQLLWIGSTAALLAALAVYAATGARFMRESAAGRIGTGMFLAMLGFALVWLVQVPFRIVGNWWDRHHAVSRASYLEVVLGGWLGLGVTFVLLCLAVLVVMGLAGLVGERWWLLAAPVFVAEALLFAFVQPYLVTDAHPIRDPALAADVRRIARAEGEPGVRVEVEDVSRYTSSANAYATGLGPSKRIFLWDTLLDGRFSEAEVRTVLAHEFGHHARDHLWKEIGWYALFAFPGAYLIAAGTRRRGGMARPESVPLALLLLAALDLAALPLQNLISRHDEAEADWVALQTTRDPGSFVGLVERFQATSLDEPNPPTWEYVLLEDHPTLMQRIAMAEAWRRRVAARR
ncbi:MAG TPA: M48 family metalloprotease [Gaiellaceae bacterium]|nr:M48 family metalloprotease [Gaiellaceae bacterium]